MSTLYKLKDLSVNFCGVEFENPFILAAAPPSDELEMVKNAFRMGWAGAVLKTTHVKEEIVDLVYPMMSSIEYEGKRVSALGNIDLVSEYDIDEIEYRIKELKKEFPNKVVIGSMMGGTKEDWQQLASRLAKAGADIIECSFSCPQGSMGKRPGAMLGQDPDLSKIVAGWVKEAAGNVPVVIKITPQVADIVEVVEKLKEGGADAVCAANTIPSLMGIDLDTFVPYPNVGGKSTYSGLSGPAIKPISLRTIAEIKRNVDIEITGTGGVSNWVDAVEFMLVGSSNIQICTAVMHKGFRIIDDLNSGLSNYMEEKNIEKVSDLIGKSLPHIVMHNDLPRKITVKAKINEDECISCGLCYIACRDGGHMAIDRLNDRIYKVDSDKCKGCNLCPQVCPVYCIELEEAK
ncbi:MAG: NAD-dependent dihydropyrimidine dehydrogenase subunit PreA [Cyanobacteriota bacterium]